MGRVKKLLHVAVTNNKHNLKLRQTKKGTFFLKMRKEIPDIRMLNQPRLVLGMFVCMCVCRELLQTCNLLHILSNLKTFKMSKYLDYLEYHVTVIVDIIMKSLKCGHEFLLSSNNICELLLQEYKMATFRTNIFNRCQIFVICSFEKKMKKLCFLNPH